MKNLRSSLEIKLTGNQDSQVFYFKNGKPIPQSCLFYFSKPEKSTLRMFYGESQIAQAEIPQGKKIVVGKIKIKKKRFSFSVSVDGKLVDTHSIPMYTTKNQKQTVA